MNRLALYLALIVTVFLAAGSSPAANAAETYVLDSGHSDVHFSSLHFGVAYLGGMFMEVSGSLELDPEDLTKSSVQITMKTATLATTNQERTDAVLSQFFLDAPKYPEITFASTKLEESDGGLTLTGNLTICAVTKEVSFPFTMRGPRPDPFGVSRVGVEGKMTLNRQDFGVTFDRKMKDGTPWWATRCRSCCPWNSSSVPRSNYKYLKLLNTNRFQS